MTAKKNIIKDLRQEVNDLEAELANYKKGMRTREKWFTRIQSTHDYEMSLINSQTNNIANTLRYKFNKDLSWLALTNDPKSKFQYIKYVIASLNTIAEPLDEDDD